MCLRLDILYVCSPQKQLKTGERKMLEMLMWSFWLILGAYGMWYFFKAKDVQTLTLDNLILTWKLHKHQANCKAPRIQSLLTKHGEVVGFQCECGYKFLQTRLLTQKVPYSETNITPLISHTATIPKRADNSLQELDLSYICIKEV